MNMFDCILNSNNIIIQQLMKGDNSQINIHIEQAGGSLGGDLASWSTFALYGITILLMVITGNYNVYDNDRTDFRWKNKNTAIIFPILVNFIWIIFLITPIRMFYINKSKEIALFTAVLVFFGRYIFINLKKQNPIKYKYTNRISNFYFAVIFFYYLYYFGTDVIPDVEMKTLAIVLIVIFTLVFFLFIMRPTEAYDLKEYIFYLTDQKCYSAKLETMKEGFLVLHDVELYNDEIAERSIDKLKHESFEVETIRNKNNKKTIISSKMIIPKEQVLAMYIVESVENIESTKDKKIKTRLILELILYILILSIPILNLYIFIRKQAKLSFLHFILAEDEISMKNLYIATRILIGIIIIVGIVVKIKFF